MKPNSDMEAPLLGDSRLRKWDLFTEELKRVSLIAAPMVIVTVSQHFIRVASMMMVGHLGEIFLSAASIATSITNVTGFSLLVGMASALETLCGQAYGAKLYHKLGIYTYGSIISMVLVCLPVSVLWIFLDKLLILMGQDPSISAEAGRYAIWCIPSLFPFALLQALMRYMLTQSLMLPMMLSSLAALVFHLPVCWALVFYFQLGPAGAAAAIGLSYLFNVTLLVVYVIYAEACQETRLCFSREVYSCIGEFFKLAVPSSVMVCLEWWTYEIVILLSGLLPNPQLETSVLSVCLMIASLHYFIPYSIGAAVSTRVSNELGAGNPEAAKVAVWTAIVVSMTEVVISAVALFLCRKFVGFAFSNEVEVVSYLEQLSPLLCLLMIMDGIQAVLSGVARGCGWQHLGAYVNLGAFYIVGLPVATILGFVVHLQGRGLWIGLNAGSVTQSFLLCLITSFTRWDMQASIAHDRIYSGVILRDGEIIAKSPTNDFSSKLTSF